MIYHLCKAVYQLLLIILTPFLLLYLLLRSRKDVNYRKRLSERFAFSLPTKKAQGGIIVHTVSVGEFNAAKPLIYALLNQYPHLPLTITCTTPTASLAITKLQQEEAKKGRAVFHGYLPFDYPFLMRRFIQFMRPKQIVILETELWPNLLDSAKALGVATLVVNARLSARSAKGYRRFAAFVKPMLNNISYILTQDKQSAKRFAALGATKVQVAGNVKYELAISQSSVTLADSIKPLLAGRKVWVAGSTHAGEDEILIAAFRRLKPLHPNLLLVLVPRHPERFNVVADLLAQSGLSFVRRSEQSAPVPSNDVWLGDSMGELLSWYQLADFVFVGGSLIERGGHNPLEAMAFAKTVISGPHIFNFQQVFSLLEKRSAYFKVENEADVIKVVDKLLSTPELAIKIGQKGLALYEAEQGAVSRIMAKVNDLISCSSVTEIKQGQSVIWFDKQFFPECNKSYFDAQFWQQQGLVTGQSTGRNTVWFVTQNDKHAVLRHYYRGGLIGKINKDIFSAEPVAKSRAMAEFSLLCYMQSKGLPVPRPCAAHFEKRFLGYSADILIERIEGTTDLAHLLQKRALTEQEWQQLGTLIATFHQHGVYHSDLNCHNILLSADGKFYLIDFDKCAIKDKGDWMAANLSRLKRSFNKELSIHGSFYWQESDWQILQDSYHKQLG